MEIEFRVIDDEQLPPVIIKKGENDSPQILINNYHKIWLCLNRGLISGIFEVFPKKVCSNNASTTCDRTGKHICTSCVTILVKGTQMQIRMKRV